MTISNFDPRSSWHNLLLHPSYFHGRCNAANFVEWILPLGQSSRTFISCVISCPLHLVEMELWKSVPSRFWTFTHHFWGWQFTSALSRNRSFANHFCEMKWKRKKKLWVYEFPTLSSFWRWNKHEIIMTHQITFGLWGRISELCWRSQPLREIQRPQRMAVIYRKLLSLFFYKKMVIPFLDDDKGAYLKIWWLPTNKKK